MEPRVQGHTAGLVAGIQTGPPVGGVVSGTPCGLTSVLTSKQDRFTERQQAGNPGFPRRGCWPRPAPRARPQVALPRRLGSTPGGGGRGGLQGAHPRRCAGGRRDQPKAGCDLRVAAALWPAPNPATGSLPERLGNKTPLPPISQRPGPHEPGFPASSWPHCLGRGLQRWASVSAPAARGAVSPRLGRD